MSWIFRHQIRSTGREYGVSIPLGYRALKKALPDILEDADNELTPIARELIAEWAEELRQLDDKIHAAQECAVSSWRGAPIKPHKDAEYMSANRTLH